MAWLGLDDSDSLEAGCTTELFKRLLERLALPYQDQRLVRLWPFAQTRTRGNAAVAARLKVESFPWETLCNAIEEQWKWLLDECAQGSEPGLILAHQQPCEELYWKAVRNHLEVDEVATSLLGIPHRSWSTSRRRGLVGAAAAIAWRGEHDNTWEYTLYRKSENIGLPRTIDERSIEQLDERFPTTFLNRDPRRKKGLIAPRSPCPVLLGIRGESKQQLREAVTWLRAQPGMEEDAGGMLWRTNQACDDHLMGSITATVEAVPEIRRRGHASVKTSKGEVVAFCEGGPVNKLLQKVIPGDVIEWLGLTHDGVWHLERLRLLKPVLRDRMRPLCDCGKRMKSKGKGQPLRCPGCGYECESAWIGRSIEVVDWVEPEPDRRRHLAAPLSRIGNPS